MNIFFVDIDPGKAAQSLCDRHVNKMITESCQMLSACLWHYDIEAPYKKVHYNHCSTRWVRASSHNYYWLLSHLEALILEFDYRRKCSDKHQRAKEALLQYQNFDVSILPSTKLTPGPLAFSSPWPNINHQLQTVLKPHYGLLNVQDKTYYPETFTSLVGAYRHYYNLKYFEDKKYPEWNWSPERKPHWYQTNYDLHLRK